MYDAYLPLVKRAGGVPKFVTLRPPHWRLDEDALKAAFSPKTKAVIFNNPLNPTATVFPREDLELLGRYHEKYNAVAICDEVWEHRSEERRVGKECVSTCRSRCARYH